jgi:hypothetical protein
MAFAGNGHGGAVSAHGPEKTVVKVRTVQVFRVERVIVHDVEVPPGEDIETMLCEGAVDAPDFDADGWRPEWDLQNAEQEVVK